MSQTTTTIAVAELQTLRITCKTDQCGAVTELALSKIPHAREIACPVCGNVLRPRAENDAYWSLYWGAKQLAEKGETMEIAFVLPG